MRRWRPIAVTVGRRKDLVLADGSRESRAQRRRSGQRAPCAGTPRATVIPSPGRGSDSGPKARALPPYSRPNPRTRQEGACEVGVLSATGSVILDKGAGQRGDAHAKGIPLGWSRRGARAGCQVFAAESDVAGACLTGDEDPPPRRPIRPSSAAMPSHDDGIGRGLGGERPEVLADGLML